MKEFLDKQSENMFLWVPMLMAFGAALYFALSFEPNILYPAFGFIACVIGILFFKKNLLLRAATLFLGGFLYATFYTQFMVSTPKIKYPMRDLNITATVTDFDVQDNKTRIILSVPADVLGASRDAIVRVSTKDDPDLQIGDVIRAQVGLFPPAIIEAPESFDYARWAYFNNLTATGFIQNYSIVKHNDTNNINSVRNTIHEKANSFLTDGLVLGYKNSVPKIDKDTWTIAGVGHIWSISGFHMTLIGYHASHPRQNNRNHLRVDYSVRVCLHIWDWCRNNARVFNDITGICRIIIRTQRNIYAKHLHCVFDFVCCESALYNTKRFSIIFCCNIWFDLVLGR